MKKQYYVPVFALALSLVMASFSMADETTSTTPGFRDPSGKVISRTPINTPKKNPLENENARYYKTTASAKVSPATVASQSGQVQLRAKIQENIEKASEMLKANREEFQAKMEAAKEKIKSELEKKNTELKAKLQRVKDERKKTTVEKINKQIDERNEKSLEQYSKTLNQLEQVLSKIETRASKEAEKGVDISGVKTEMATATQAIKDARAAIEAQSKNIYKINISTEKNLGLDVGKTRQQLKNDLEKVRTLVVNARQAVHKTAVTLGRAMGLTIATPSPTPSPSPALTESPSPSPAVTTSPSPSPAQ